MRKAGLFIFCLAGCGPLLMAQFVQGPFNPGTTTATVCAMTGGVVLAYSPPNNIQTSNNAYAMATHCGCCDDNTNCLNSTNFGFTIPAGATITGIMVDIEKFSDFGSNVQDNQLFLLKAGSYVGINHANLWTPWAWTDTYSSYGSCTDLWGDTWTPADINAANFGVVFATIDYTCGPNVNSFIDHVRMSVCYDLALPVTLTEFSGTPGERSNHLKWKTVAEINNDHFIIERSADAEHYIQVGAIMGVGNSNEEHSYFFDDTNPINGTNYYRLIQQDHNGTKEIFDPISVEFHSGQIEFKSHWMDDQLQLELISSFDKEICIELISLSGEMIYQHNFNLVKGNNLLRCDLPGMSPGMFLVRLKYMDKSYSPQIFRLVK